MTKRNGFSGSCVRRLTLVFHTGEPKIMTNGASCWALQERDTIHGCSRHRGKKCFLFSRRSKKKSALSFSFSCERIGIRLRKFKDRKLTYRQNINYIRAHRKKAQVEQNVEVTGGDQNSENFQKGRKYL